MKTVQQHVPYFETKFSMDVTDYISSALASCGYVYMGNTDQRSQLGMFQRTCQKFRLCSASDTIVIAPNTNSVKSMLDLFRPCVVYHTHGDIDLLLTANFIFVETEHCTFRGMSEFFKRVRRVMAKHMSKTKLFFFGSYDMQISLPSTFWSFLNWKLKNKTSGATNMHPLANGRGLVFRHSQSREIFLSIRKLGHRVLRRA